MSGVVVLNVEAGRFAAVGLEPRGGRVRVVGAARGVVPSEMGRDDAAAMSGWVRERLKDAGLLKLASRGVVLGVPRGEVILKRLRLPKGLREDETPETVGLLIARQAAVTLAQGAVDYIPGPEGDEAPEVLAASLENENVERRVRLAKAMKARLARIGLMAEGAAALLAEESLRLDAAVLGVSLGDGSAEFVVVDRGRLVYARATDLPRPGEGEEAERFAERVAVEAKRTWMSLRVAPEPPEIEAVIVAGDDDLARSVAEACAREASLQARVSGWPSMVEGAEDAGVGELSAVAPLIGLGAQHLLGAETLDFAHPRRAPDKAAKWRQRALAAAALVIVLGGVAYTIGAQREGDLKARKDDLDERYNKLWAQHRTMLREQATVDHAERWVDGGFDWLGHLEYLSTAAPSTEVSTLRLFRGSGQTDVGFGAPGGRRGNFYYSEGQWSASSSGTIAIEGWAADRGLADAIRAGIAESEVYRLETRGPDAPTGFEFLLSTSALTPKATSDSDADDTEGGDS